MTVKGLGNAFDVGSAFMPVDLGTAGATGHRVHMRNYGGLAFVGLLAAGTAAQATTFDVQEHTAATGGTSRDLDVVTAYYKKEEAVLDGDETWSKVEQSAASEVTDADWDDANQVIVVIEVDATQLSDDCEWLSVNAADPGTAQLGAGLYIMYGLKVQRAPENLAQPNA